MSEKHKRLCDLPKNDWGGWLTFDDLSWHIQQAVAVFRLNRAIEEADL